MEGANDKFFETRTIRTSDRINYIISLLYFIIITIHKLLKNYLTVHLFLNVIDIINGKEEMIIGIK